MVLSVHARTLWWNDERACGVVVVCVLDCDGSHRGGGERAVKHRKRPLAKELQQVAKELAEQTRAVKKTRRQQRQRERRERYGQSTQGPDARTDPGPGSSPTRGRGAEEGAPWREGRTGAGKDHEQAEERAEEEGPLMYEAHDHTLSPGCWCAPVVIHVPPDATVDPPFIVANVRDADRLAELGITNVVVSPDVPNQRGGSMTGGDNGCGGNGSPLDGGK